MHYSMTSTFESMLPRVADRTKEVVVEVGEAVVVAAGLKPVVVAGVETITEGHVMALKVDLVVRAGLQEALVVSEVDHPEVVVVLTTMLVASVVILTDVGELAVAAEVVQVVVMLVVELAGTVTPKDRLI